MSNNLVVASVSIPASASAKECRAVAKALMTWAGEAALSDGKVKPEAVFAAGLSFAILGAADNQAAGLKRIMDRMGAKPSATQLERLKYWQACCSAGRAVYDSKADTIALSDLLARDDVQSWSASAIASDAQRKIAEKKKAEELAAQQKRIKAVSEAAAKNAASMLDAANAAAYRDAMHHGAEMDNGAARAFYAASNKAAEKQAAAAAASAAESARLAAWREEQAAVRVADIANNRAIAESEFRQLADALGIKLTAAQLRQLEQIKQAA